MPFPSSNVAWNFRSLRSPLRLAAGQGLTLSSMRAFSRLHYLCILAVTGDLAAQQPPSIRLDAIDAAIPGLALPPGWQSQSVRGAPAARSEVTQVGGYKVLRFDADGEALWVGRELEQPLHPDQGRLTWVWRLDHRLSETALRDPARDDAAARLVVVFGRPGLFGGGRVLFYTWGNREPKEGAWMNPSNRRFGVLVVRNASDPADQWLEEERDLGADYRRVFGGEPPAVRAIGYMIDTEQTGERGASLLASIRWREAR